MKKVILLIFLFGLFPFILNARETLPPYHWSWKYLNYLKVTGNLPDLDMSNRPVYRDQVARWLVQIDREKLPLRSLERQMLRILYREFQDEIRLYGETAEGTLKQAIESVLRSLQTELLPETVVPRIKIGAFATAGLDYSDVSGDTQSEFQFHPQLGLHFGDRLAFYGQLKIFNRADSEYVGKEFRNLYAYAEQAYFLYRGNFLQFKFGRDFLQIGPGRSGQLLISDNSRTFDMYHLRVGSHRVQFSFFGIQLNRRRTVHPQLVQYAPEANRYLNGHRLSFNVKNRYYFGFSEVVVYGGPNANWELGFMNPFAPYYGYNANGPFTSANLFYNIDWDLYLPHRLEIYGEFLIDDFQVDKKEPGDLEPNELGLMVGVNWGNPLRLPGSLLNLEYVQIRNRTYNAPQNDWEKYLHRGRVIGYFLGNDFKRYSASLEKWWRADLNTRLFATLVRKGEGTVAGEFNTDYLNYTVEQGYKEPFPWGIVERHWQAGFSIFFRPHRLGNLSFSLAYNDFKNYQHIEGKSQRELSISLTLWLQWNHLSSTKFLK